MAMDNLQSLLDELLVTVKSKPSDIKSPFSTDDKSSSFGQKVLSNAQSDLGVREDLGHNDGKRIREYFKPFGMNAGQDWCAAAVATWMREAGGGPIPGAVGARNIAGQFANVNRWVPKDKINQVPSSLTPGNIAIWSRGPSGSNKGHIGVIESFNGNGFVSIEANSGPKSDSVVRNSHSINDTNLLGIGILSDYVSKHKLENSAYLIEKSRIFLKLSTKM